MKKEIIYYIIFFICMTQLIYDSFILKDFISMTIGFLGLCLLINMIFGKDERGKEKDGLENDKKTRRSKTN